MILPGLTGTYQVLPCLTRSDGSYWVLLGPTGSYSVLPGLTMYFILLCYYPQTLRGEVVSHMLDLLSGSFDFSGVS